MNSHASTSSQLNASNVATCALQHYKSLKNHGKPRKGQEWTVFAALVVSEGSLSPHVVCSATGSKCTTTGPEGLCLRDLHAEVLVKRGLQRMLWKEIRTGNLRLLRKVPPKEASTGDWCTHELNPKLSLHLFISDSPCGDATIYELENGQINFTGAKLLEDDLSRSEEDAHLLCWNDVSVSREKAQALGKLRIKSGRSNLPGHMRSTSLSCSDKILQWSLLGMQGSLLPIHPIRLTSVVVSRDPNAKSSESQRQALDRAIVARAGLVIKDLEHNADFCRSNKEFLESLKSHFTVVSVVDDIFESAKSQLVVPVLPEMSDMSPTLNKNGKRGLSERTTPPAKKVPPCGFCFNYQQSDGMEVLVGGRGTKQGKKPIADADYDKQASRLCRRMMHPPSKEPCLHESYSAWKESLQTYSRKTVVFQTKTLERWVKSNRDFCL